MPASKAVSTKVANRQIRISMAASSPALSAGILAEESN